MPIMYLTVEQSFVEQVNSCLKEINSDRVHMTMSATDIAREALSVYQWFVKKTALGYAVVAINRDLTQLVQVCTPHVPARKPLI